MTSLVPITLTPPRVWRYQRCNQNSYIEEEQTTQWPSLMIISKLSTFNLIRFLILTIMGYLVGHQCKSRAYFISDKCNVPNEIWSWDFFKVFLIFGITFMFTWMFWTGLMSRRQCACPLESRTFGRVNTPLMLRMNIGIYRVGGLWESLSTAF